MSSADAPVQVKSGHLGVVTVVTGVWLPFHHVVATVPARREQQNSFVRLLVTADTL